MLWGERKRVYSFKICLFGNWRKFWIMNTVLLAKWQQVDKETDSRKQSLGLKSALSLPALTSIWHIQGCLAVCLCRELRYQSPLCPSPLLPQVCSLPCLQVFESRESSRFLKASWVVPGCTARHFQPKECYLSSVSTILTVQWEAINVKINALCS